MTEENHQDACLKQYQALIAQKELELKKREKELEELKSSFESLSSNLPPSPERLIQLLQESSDEMSKESFYNLMDEVAVELGNFKNGHISVINTPNIRHLLSKFKMELHRRLRISRLTCEYIRSWNGKVDSTSNDVTKISLNHCSALSPLPSYDETIKDVSSISQAPKSCLSSKKYINDTSLHSESTFKTFDECTPDDESLHILHSLSSMDKEENNSSTPKLNGSPPSVFSSRIAFDCEGSHCDNSANDENSTTPRAIRRNSYTLESPSPCVLTYLRNLALEQSSEKESKTDPKHPSASKSVVRNLNNDWNKDVVKKNLSEDISPDFRDSLEDIVNGSYDKKRKGTCGIIDNDMVTSYNEHILSHNIQENEKNLRKTKAAVIIQAHARGFLVRRLMRTYKVEEMKNVIKDAVICAWGLYKEEAVSPLDLQLHDRIIQQVTAACYELHSIFFVWPTTEKMALIKEDRERKKNPRPKPRSSRPRTSSSDSMSSSLSRSSSLKIPQKNSTHKRTKSNELEINRPTTLPSVRKSPTMLNYKPWK